MFISSINKSVSSFVQWLTDAFALRGNGQNSWLLSLLLVFAVAVLYGQFLWNPIVFDDVYFFRLGSDAMQHYGDTFAPFESRWLPYATLAWTGKLFGLEMINFRIGNLLLHAATAVAIYLLLSELFRRVLPGWVSMRHGGNTLALNWVAFFAALFFALHPVAVYGAAYLIERTIVMATLFSVLALYTYLRGLSEGRTGLLWVSVILYAVAVFSKEHAVTLPAVMLALTVLLEKPSKALFRRLWAVYVACALIVIYVAMQKLGIMGASYEINAFHMLNRVEAQHPLVLSELTQSALFFKYLMLWLLPNPAWMSVDMREPFASSLFSPYWLAAAAFIGYGIFAFILLLKRGVVGLAGFAMLFPWLMFFTEFAVVRIQEPFVLYRSYLWVPGLFAAMPLITRYFRAKPLFLGLLAIGLMLIPLSINRLATFSHPLLLWDDAATLVQGRDNLVGVPRIYCNRGVYLSNAGLYKEALEDFEKVIALEPRYFMAYAGIGGVYFKQGLYAKAVNELSRAIALEPRYELAFKERALTYLAMGNIKAAQADFAESCRLGRKSSCQRLR